MPIRGVNTGGNRSIPRKFGLNLGTRFGQYLIRLNPYLRMLGVSGSLANPRECCHDDVDYFTVSTKNRVWECYLAIYSLIFFYSKLIRQPRDLFCFTYLIDENVLDKELHIDQIAANELLNLRVLLNPVLYQNIIRSKPEIQQYYPFRYQKRIRELERHHFVSTDNPNGFGTRLFRKIFSVVLRIVTPLFRKMYRVVEGNRKRYLDQIEVQSDKFYSSPFVIRMQQNRSANDHLYQEEQIPIRSLHKVAKVQS